MNLAARVALQQAEKVLTARVEELRARLQAEPGLWPDFLDVLRTLATITVTAAPEAGGALLTTAELAERVGVTAKTLLKRKGRGEIKPTIERGKFLRWSPRVVATLSEGGR